MLTNKEREALQGILDSDYMDGETEWPHVGKPVWTWSANPFKTKKTFSGVVSSLVAKGYVKSTDEGEESIICITESGWLAFQNK